MNQPAADWSIRLSDAAAADYSNIIRWTLMQFGEQQARLYAETLSATLRELSAGPSQPGVRARDEIAAGILTLHVARKRRKGRHFVMFRIAEDGDRTLDVLRLLHDAMEPVLHLPS